MPSTLAALYTPELTRTRLWWAVGAMLVLAQLVALYLLCSEQVRKADARDAVWRERRVAIGDCMQGRQPHSTFHGCVAHLASTGQVAVDLQPVSPAAVVPVNFAYR